MEEKQAIRTQRKGWWRILKDKTTNLIKSNYEKRTANILSGIRQCFLPEFSSKTCVLTTSTQYCSGHSSLPKHCPNSFVNHPELVSLREPSFYSFARALTGTRTSESQSVAEPSDTHTHTHTQMPLHAQPNNYILICSHLKVFVLSVFSFEDSLHFSFDDWFHLIISVSFSESLSV